jgi:LPS-assembly lipoprotein
MWWFDIVTIAKQTLFSKGLALIVLAVLVGACGFRPLYGSRSTGTSTVDAMALVEVDKLSGRYGQIIRNQLLDHLTPRGKPSAPRYRLRLDIETQKEALAIEQDETVERFNFRLVAKYSLVDLTTASTVFRARSQSIAAYNVVRSDYATLVAEQDAAKRVAREVTDDIKLQLAVFFDRLLTPHG